LERLVSDILTVDTSVRRVVLMGEPIHLSPKEYALFELLARRAGQVVTQRRLMIAGWDDPTVDSQYLRSYIAMLREKLEADPSEPELILTEPGVGYRLSVPLRATA
jgi:two-component system KDP operon response regulator KdpE